MMPRGRRRVGRAGWLGGLLAAPESPTADLYFADACADLLETGQVRRLAPTVFQAGGTVIVIRHDARVSPQVRADRLIYVTDDDVAAGLSDRLVPMAYRAKLAFLERRAERRLAPAADLILAASDPLARTLSAYGPPVRRIDPAWPSPPEPQRCEGRLVRVAVLMARSHAADFGFLIPVLDRLMADRPNWTLTVSANLPIPRRWRHEAQVTILPVLGWAGYREWMAGQRFDIGLYPVLPGGMNDARSANKLSEYAQLGAAIVTSQNWAPGAEAAALGRCLALPNDPDLWCRELNCLIDAPSALTTVARVNAAALISEAALDAQRKLWIGVLGGGEVE